jgi:hypothetical protein
MLRHYMAEQWVDDHRTVVVKLLDQPGAFVREVALQARMLAAHERRTVVTLELLEQSVESLARQMYAEKDFLMQRRPIGLGTNSRRYSRPSSPLGPPRLK